MNDIRELVQAGLHEENLRKLIPLCKAHLTEYPALYGSLILIFESLAEEYDNQGISVERADLIRERMQGPILLLLQKDETSPPLIKRLDDVFESFVKLKGY